MNAFEMNDQIMTGVMKGMGAAASRFEARMNSLRENSDEIKRSEFFYSYAMNLAKQVDELCDAIKQHDREMVEKQSLLKNANERANTYNKISNNHSDYLNLVVKRLNNVEDVLQRQCADAYALKVFHEYALQELKENPVCSQSSLLNEKWRKEFYDLAWSKFMNTTSVKRGIPRLGIDAP